VAATRKMRVLLVDDSAIVRKILADALRAEPDIEVVGGAADPIIARDMIRRLNPDVITLDIEMPRMDGLTFLRWLMEHRPIPTIMISSLTSTGSAATIEALRIGAVDVLAKPAGPRSTGEVVERLKHRIRALRDAPPLRLRSMPVTGGLIAAVASDAGRRLNGLLAIGASTGGTQAIESLLTRLPADMPPIVIAQHMPRGFTAAFAARLDSVVPMRVVEAGGGETLERGVAYIAPGDRHLLVETVGFKLRTRLSDGPRVQYQRPAVDVLFASLARLLGIPVVAALLTGMGADGADGMVALRAAGAETIAEAEESCVVFGMPKEAIARGGAMHVTPLVRMPIQICASFEQLTSRARKQPASRSLPTPA
jgi:two-component system chemotaxis response regulator CheB